MVKTISNMTFEIPSWKYYCQYRDTTSTLIFSCYTPKPHTYTYVHVCTRFPRSSCQSYADSNLLLLCTVSTPVHVTARRSTHTWTTASEGLPRKLFHWITSHNTPEWAQETLKTGGSLDYWRHECQHDPLVFLETKSRCYLGSPHFLTLTSWQGSNDLGEVPHLHVRNNDHVCHHVKTKKVCTSRRVFPPNNCEIRW